MRQRDDVDDDAEEEEDDDDDEDDEDEDDDDDADDDGADDSIGGVRAWCWCIGSAHLRMVRHGDVIVDSLLPPPRAPLGAVDGRSSVSL